MGRLERGTSSGSSTDERSSGIDEGTARNVSPDGEKTGSNDFEMSIRTDVSSPANHGPEQPRRKRRKVGKRGSDSERVPQSSLPTPGSTTNNVGSSLDTSNPDGKPSTTPPSTMQVIPSRHLSSGKAYCSINDAVHFLPGPGFEEGMVLVNDQIVLKVLPDATVPDGFLALDSSERWDARVSLNQNARVARCVPGKLLTITLKLAVVRSGKRYHEKHEDIVVKRLTSQLTSECLGKMTRVGKLVYSQDNGTTFTFKVKKTTQAEQPAHTVWGLWTKDTHLILEFSDDCPIDSRINTPHQEGGHSGIDNSSPPGRNLFKTKDFSFQKLGIGGLDYEFEDVFRRAFTSRLFPPDTIQKLGIKHVKGMLLWGPPGTGKTLIARQIGKMLSAKTPKVVNGPEVVSKWVGESERNIRNLFADAEKDQNTLGDDSDVHIIIFDEIDAICKTRSSSGSTSGTNDGIVNQLLTKIDGVKSLNNILLIGMTNRKDLIDEALLRPGRLEVHIEIGLPDEKGRLQILQIHSSKMQQSSCLSDDVDLVNLAARTQNFSGAELEGLVRSATSFALSRQVDFEDLSKPMDGNVNVRLSDFERALNEVIPAFGTACTTLERFKVNAMLDCGPRNDHVQKTAKILVDEVKTNEHTPLLSCLLQGPGGSGKTALAAMIALESDVPFIKMISAESMVGHSESTKCELINKVFEDAYKSPASLIIIDDIERIIEYVNVGPRFSNLILQALLVLIKKLPPKGRKLLIIGTTSMKEVMGALDISSAFNVSIPVPTLSPNDIKNVLLGLDVFTPEEVAKAVNVVGGTIPIKKLLVLIGMSKRGGNGQGSSGKVDLRRFEKYYNDLAW